MPLIDENNGSTLTGILVPAPVTPVSIIGYLTLLILDILHVIASLLTCNKMVLCEYFAVQTLSFIYVNVIFNIYIHIYNLKPALIFLLAP